MRVYFVRLTKSDFTAVGNVFTSAVIDVYNNSTYKNYSVTRSLYGLDNLGDDTWTGLRQLTSTTTDTGILVLQGATPNRYIDTSGRADIVSWNFEPTFTTGAGPAVGSLEVYASDVSTSVFPDEFSRSGPFGTADEIGVIGSQQYLKFKLTVDAPTSSVYDFVVYVRVEIDIPVMAPKYRRTQTMLDQFPAWMAMRELESVPSIPELATPSTIGGALINALAGEWIEELANSITYLDYQNYIDSVDINQVAWVYRVLQAPDFLYSVIGDGVALAQAASLREFLEGNSEDVYSWNENEDTIYCTKAYASLTINGVAFSYVPHHVWNNVDDIGLLVDLRRLHLEGNDSFRKRILDVHRNRLGAGVDSFKKALRRELNLWKYWSAATPHVLGATPAATPDSSFYGATPDVLEIEDLEKDPLYVQPDGMPTQRFIDLVNRLAIDYPTTWGRFRWDRTFWDQGGPSHEGYGILPYRFDATPLTEADTQTGVGDEDDLLLLRPDAITGPHDFTARLIARGRQKTTRTEYPTIEFNYEVYGQSDRKIYTNAVNDVWMTLEVTITGGEKYSISFMLSAQSDVDAGHATPTSASFASYKWLADAALTTNPDITFHHMVNGADYPGGNQYRGAIPLASITNVTLRMGRWDIETQAYLAGFNETSDTFEAWFAHAPGTVLKWNTAALSCPSVAGGVSMPMSPVLMKSKMTSYVVGKWQSEHVPGSVRFNTASPNTVAKSETINLPTIVWDAYQEATPNREIIFQLKTQDSAGLYGAQAKDESGVPIFLPASYIQLDGSSSWSAGKRSLSSVLTTTTVSSGSGGLYPIQATVWTLFEANQTVPFLGVVDENGPWKNGNASAPGNTNFILTSTNVSRNSFGIANTTSYVITWMGVEVLDDPQVIIWLDSNTVKPAVVDGSTVEYPANAVQEIFAAGVYSYSSFPIRARLRTQPSPEWNPYIHSGWYYQGNREGYIYAEPHVETVLPNLLSSTPSTFELPSVGTWSNYANSTVTWAGVGSVRLPGVANNYISQPDSVANSILGDLDVRARVSLDDWTPGANQTILAKYNTSSQRSYRLYVDTVGKLNFAISNDGTAITSHTSSVAVPAADGDVKWVRATFDIDNGAAGRSTIFYTSPDGNTWTQLGTTQTTAGVYATIFNSTSVLELGAFNTGSAETLKGHIYKIEVRNGIGGSVASAFDAAAVSVVNTQSPTTTFQSGATWTLTGTQWSWVMAQNSMGALAVQSTAAATVEATTTRGTGGIPVTAGASYTASASFRAGGTGRSVQTWIWWFDVGGSFISNTASTAVTDSTTAWVTSTITASAPSTAKTAAVAIRVSSPATNETHYVDNAYLFNAGAAYSISGAARQGAPIVVETIEATPRQFRQVAFSDQDASPVALSLRNKEIVQGSGTTTLYLAHPNVYNAAVTEVGSGKLLEPGVDLPGTTGNYIFAPDSAAVSITGDIDLRIKVAMDDWTPTGNQMFISKLNGPGQYSYGFRIVSGGLGQINFLWTTDGTTVNNFTATAPTPAWVDGSTHWLRVVLDVNNGASGRTCTMYHSTDGVGWTQFYNSITAGVTSIFDGTAGVGIGGRHDQADFLAGVIYYAEIRNGIGGPVAAYLDAETIDVTGAQIPTTVVNGTTTWTVSGTGWNYYVRSTATNQLITNTVTSVDKDYEVSYYLVDSFMADHRTIASDGTLRTQLTFDKTPFDYGLPGYNVTYEGSRFDPATPIDVPLSPLYTSSNESYVFLSHDEYTLDRVEVAISPTKVLADGEDYLVSTFRSLDRYGNPKPNQTFSLSTTFGTLDKTSVTTDRDGFAMAVLTASSSTNSATGSITVSGGAAATLPFEIEPTVAAGFRLLAMPRAEQIPADGRGQNLVYGRVEDSRYRGYPYAWIRWKRARSLYDLFAQPALPDATPSNITTYTFFSDATPVVPPAATPVTTTITKTVTRPGGAPTSRGYMHGWYSHDISGDETAIGKNFAVVRYYHDKWTGEVSSVVTGYAAAGKLVLSSHKPPAVPDGWQRVADGREDTKIKALAAAYKAINKEIVFIFHHEPHDEASDVKPGQTTYNGVASQFIAAFRRIVGIFKNAGANKVKFGYCAVDSWAVKNPDPLYPGDQYVDVFCHDAYNWYDYDSRTWKSFEDNWKSGVALAKRREKPLIIGEWGSHPSAGAGRQLAQWFLDAAYYIKNDPDAKIWLIGGCYYHTIHKHDWRFLGQNTHGATHGNGANDGKSGWTTGFVNDAYFKSVPFPIDMNLLGTTETITEEIIIYPAPGQGATPTTSINTSTTTTTTTPPPQKFSGRVIADANGNFTIGPFITTAPEEAGYWFVSAELDSVTQDSFDRPNGVLIESSSGADWEHVQSSFSIVSEAAAPAATTAMSVVNITDAVTPTRSLRLPGTVGNYFSTPDSAAISVIGDLDIRAKVAMDDWTPAGRSALVAKWVAGGNQKSYALSTNSTGTLDLLYCKDGSTSLEAVSTVIVPNTDGATGWVRVTRVAATGVIQFFTSSDGVVWTQLGTSVSGTSGNLFDSTAPLLVGNRDGVDQLTGNIYYAEVRSGIDGTTVAKFDLSTVMVTGTRTPSSLSSGGATWTATGSAWDWNQDADVAVEMTITDAGAGGATALGPVVRYTDTNNYFYVLHSSRTSFRIRKVQGGTHTDISTLVSPTPAIPITAPYTVRLEAEDGSLRLYVNGALLTSATSYLNRYATRHGMRNAAGDVGARVNSFLLTNLDIEDGAVGDVAFWNEYPDVLSGVDPSHGLPRPSIQESTNPYDIPKYAAGAAFPSYYDEATPYAPATPVTTTWLPPKWYALPKYQQYQLGLLGNVRGQVTYGTNVHEFRKVI